MDQSHIRNFCIIAHIDHGKSTLADRLLEITGTVEKRKMKEQLLDQMDLERERGITIKLQPVRMLYSMPQTSADKTRTVADGDLLYKDLTYQIRGAVFDVRKQLGSGQKELIYQNALEIEFQKRKLPYEREKTLGVLYDEKKVGVYRPDFVVDEKIIVELKALPYIGKQEEHQFWHYLKGTDYRLALLVNFSPKGADIRRLIHDKESPPLSVSSPPESVYQLNLIDTPGHVDFTYEVSRSLAACEGAILVVDATQGIQAQTLANVKLALEHKLTIIPVVNKIDLPNADREAVAEEIMTTFGFEKNEILFVSAKTGEGVEKILKTVIEKIPPPQGGRDEPLRALIFDSKYDKHRGVVAFVRVMNGSVRGNQPIKFINTAATGQAIEVGYFAPELRKDDGLAAGEVGYIVTGLREVSRARVGDTITTRTSTDKIRPRTTADGQHLSVLPLPGYKEIRPMVYASIFPESGDDYPRLRDAMEKLKLSDASLQFEPENIPSLGFGFRTGFLGLLHMDIVRERLTREFGLELVLTAPSVAYIVKKTNGEEETIYTPVKLPDMSIVESLSEPWVTLEIITPERYLGAIMSLVTGRRGIYRTTNYLGPGRLDLRFEAPLANIVTDFYDKLKGSSAGYASMNYDFLDYRVGDLVRVDILVAGDRVDALATIVHRKQAEVEGRRFTEKLKELIPKQQFPVALQAAIGGKIIARETIAAMRKDVTAGLYGGDVSRKMKVLKKQKKGKKRLTAAGRVDIPHEAFLSLLRR